MTKNKILTLCCCLLFLSGCMSVSYTRTEPGGEKVSFSTSSMWTKKQIKDVTYGAGTNGLRTFRLQGFTEDQTAVAIQALVAALAAYSNHPAPVVP